MTEPTPISFSVYSGDTLLRTKRFAQGLVKIGRKQSLDLVLDDPSVARMHAVAEIREGEQPVIIDLGLGTLLNGEPLNKAPLRTGDRLTVGCYHLVVAVGADAWADYEAVPVPPRPEPDTGGVVPPPEWVMEAATAKAEPAADAAPPPESDAPPPRVTGTRFVTPGTAVVVRSRRTGEVVSVRTHGRVIVWPFLQEGWELQLAPLTVEASASGEGAAQSADGQVADVTLHLTLRPKADEAAVRELVDVFGEAPTRAVVARRVVEVLGPQLAVSLAGLALGDWVEGRALELDAPTAFGYALERAEVARAGQGAPAATEGYRERVLDLATVRFVGGLP